MWAMLPGRGSLRDVGVAVAEGHMAPTCVAGIVAVGATSLKLHTPRVCVLVALCCSAVGLIPSRVVPCVHSVAMVGGRACHAITMAYRIEFWCSCKSTTCIVVCQNAPMQLQYDIIMMRSYYSTLKL